MSRAEYPQSRFVGQGASLAKRRHPEPENCPVERRSTGAHAATAVVGPSEWNFVNSHVEMVGIPRRSFAALVQSGFVWQCGRILCAPLLHVHAAIMRNTFTQNDAENGS